MNELALFAGAGGGILGGHLLGWRAVCAVEINEYCRRILMLRQNEGLLEPFPIWDDIRTFDGRPWRGVVDVVSGGFPCQDISSAGKGAGLAGARSGLWSEMARVVREVGPRYVLVENSPLLARRGLGAVLGDLAEMGYDARWGVLGAADAGAPHRRKRMWIVAVANADRDRQLAIGPDVVATTIHPQGGGGDQAAVLAERGARDVPASSPGCPSGHEHDGGPAHAELDAGAIWPGPDWPAEPDVDRVADGVAHRVDRLRALGNGQVPRVVATAWRVLGHS